MIRHSTDLSWRTDPRGSIPSDTTDKGYWDAYVVNNNRERLGWLFENCPKATIDFVYDHRSRWIRIWFGDQDEALSYKLRWDGVE